MNCFSGKLPGLLLTVLVLFNSCKSYEATVKNSKQLEYGAVQVDPEWKYKKTGKWIFVLVGASAGAAYGYESDILIDQVENQEQNALVWGGAGLLGGLLLGNIIIKGGGNRDIKPSEAPKWVSKYNQATNKNYLLHEVKNSNDLLLITRELNDELSQTRKELKKIGSELKANNEISWGQLQNYRQSLNTKYRGFLNVEISEIENQIVGKESDAAYVETLKRLQDELDNPTSYPSLVSLSGFWTANNKLFTKLSQERRVEINQTLDNRKGEILKFLMDEEETEIAKLPTSLADINMTDKFYQNFDQKYRVHRNEIIVSDVYQEISRKKSEIVLSNIKSVSQQIDRASTIDAVEDLDNLYLRNTISDDRINEIKNQISDRKSQIIAAERQLALEKQAKERKYIAEEMDGFTTQGLNFADAINNIFRGDFEKIMFNREDMVFSSLIGSYMRGFAETSCMKAIPSHQKVQIMDRECAGDYNVTYQYGVEISRECIRWIQVGSGLYTSPEMYSAYNGIEGLLAGDMLNNLGKILLDPESMVKSTTDLIAAKSDMIQLIRMNGCDNAGLKRFEENLIRFAINKQGIKLNLPGERSSSQPTTPDYSKNQDFNQFVKDLVFQNSKSWSTGYVSNSTTNVRVTSKDRAGRPLEITAEYQFEGFFGRQTDQIRIPFVDGIPVCLYFKAYSFACRTPDRGIVNDLIKGKYIRK